MNDVQRKLKRLSKGKKSTWLTSAETRFRKRKWLNYSSKIARRILAAMEDSDNINQKKLANILDVSPQYINKVVKGKENLSLETIAKLSEALKVELISFPDYKYSPTKNSVMTTHHFFIGLAALNVPYSWGKDNRQELSISSNEVHISQDYIASKLLPIVANTVGDTFEVDSTIFSLVKQIPNEQARY